MTGTGEGKAGGADGRATIGGNGAGEEGRGTAGRGAGILAIG